MKWHVPESTKVDLKLKLQMCFIYLFFNIFFLDEVIFTGVSSLTKLMAQPHGH